MFTTANVAIPDIQDWFTPGALERGPLKSLTTKIGTDQTTDFTISVPLPVEKTFTTHPDSREAAPTTKKQGDIAHESRFRGTTNTLERSTLKPKHSRHTKMP